MTCSGMWIAANGIAVSAAATKKLCRRSSRVCRKPAQAASSQRLTRRNAIAIPRTSRQSTFRLGSADASPSSTAMITVSSGRARQPPATSRCRPASAGSAGRAAAPPAAHRRDRSPAAPSRTAARSAPAARTLSISSPSRAGKFFPGMTSYCIRIGNDRQHVHRAEGQEEEGGNRMALHQRRQSGSPSFGSDGGHGHRPPFCCFAPQALRRRSSVRTDRLNDSGG